MQTEQKVTVQLTLGEVLHLLSLSRLQQRCAEDRLKYCEQNTHTAKADTCRAFASAAVEREKRVQQTLIAVAQQIGEQENAA